MRTHNNLLTASWVAKRLGVSKRKVYYMMENRELPYVQVGARGKKVDPDELQAYIDRNHVDVAC